MPARLFIGGPLDGMVLDISHEREWLAQAEPLSMEVVRYRPHRYISRRLVPHDGPWVGHPDVTTGVEEFTMGLALFTVLSEPIYWTDDAWADECQRQGIDPVTLLPRPTPADPADGLPWC